jgi:hypothetical protein
MHLDAERFKLLCHDVRRAVLGKAQFRIGMEVAPLRGQLGVVGLDALDRFQDWLICWLTIVREKRRFAKGRTTMPSQGFALVMVRWRSANQSRIVNSQQTCQPGLSTPASSNS